MVYKGKNVSMIQMSWYHNYYLKIYFFLERPLKTLIIVLIMNIYIYIYIYIYNIYIYTYIYIYIYIQIYIIYIYIYISIYNYVNAFKVKNIFKNYLIFFQTTLKV